LKDILGLKTVSGQLYWQPTEWQKRTVTVDMAVQVFAAEFPEFLMAVAEENFLRGYQQALD
jgi:hypothetical protein